MSRRARDRWFDEHLRALLPPVAKCLDCGREYQSYPDYAQPCGWARNDDPSGRLCGGRVVPIEVAS